jgi:hypothetical protein
MKNLPKIVVALNTQPMTVLELYSAVQTVKTTGDPNAGNPPVTDTLLHTQATTMLTVYNNSQTVPPTAIPTQVATARNIVERSYTKIGLYVQGAANDAAVAAGDVTAGQVVVTRTGYHLKHASIRAPRHFSASSNGVGQLDISTKAVGKHAGYIRRLGVTTAKGVPPSVLGDDLFTLEADIHIDGLVSGSIVGACEATILPVTHTNKTSTTTNSTQKSVTATPATKGRKASFTYGASHLIFSDWIYVVVK